MGRFADLASLALLGLVLIAHAARANDSFAEINAGGITFIQNHSVQMDEEILVISRAKISVDYRFTNVTDKDVTVTIAFPVPDMDAGALSESGGGPRGADNDPMTFRAFANGAPLSPAFHAQAVTPDGREVTEVVRAAGVPLIVETSDALTKLKPDAIKRLVAAGAVLADDLEHPHWIVKASYTWRQTFPAGGTVKIQHVYQPMAGGAVGEYLIENGSINKKSDLIGRFCMDDSFLMGVANLARAKGGVNLNWAGYILKTGANWAGPIGRFRLELPKGDADLLSLCVPKGLDLRKEGQTFVAEAANFTPRQDIEVIWVNGSARP